MQSSRPKVNDIMTSKIKHVAQYLKACEGNHIKLADQKAYIEPQDKFLSE